MALTNYLMQTIIGLLLLRALFDRGQLDRLELLIVVAARQTVQIAASRPWLDHFRFGPVEWLWRSMTYRRWQPFRR